MATSLWLQKCSGVYQSGTLEDFRSVCLFIWSLIFNSSCFFVWEFHFMAFWCLLWWTTLSSFVATWGAIPLSWCWAGLAPTRGIEICTSDRGRFWNCQLASFLILPCPIILIGRSVLSFICSHCHWHDPFHLPRLVRLVEAWRIAKWWWEKKPVAGNASNWWGKSTRCRQSTDFMSSFNAWYGNICS